MPFVDVISMSDSKTKTTAIIIVDHGSRRAASNEMLEVATKNFADRGDYQIVEPAHMELAQPDIATAFRRCVERGAKHVVVFPYFLSPGRHWSEDIPALVKQAAAPFTETTWLVTAPFGLHPGISDIIADRIQHCQNVVDGTATECDVCQNRKAACLTNCSESVCDQER